MQTVSIVVILLLPLFHIAALQAPDRTTVWMPLQPAPRPEKPATQRPSQTAPRIMRSNIFHAPSAIPARIDMSPDAPELVAPELGGVLASGSSGPLTALGATPFIPPPPARPVQAAPPAPPSLVRVSSGTQAARLIYSPKPAYPPLARTARVQGVVRIEAVIAPDGVIRNLRVVSGPPLLVSAAMTAVRQWRYQPTLLSGEPVEVATEIDVNFTLTQ